MPARPARCRGRGKGLKRRLAGWVLLTLGTAAAAAWAASAWYDVMGGHWPAGWGFERGEILLYPTPGRPISEWMAGGCLIDSSGSGPSICWRVDMSRWAGWNVHDYWLYGTVDGGGDAAFSSIDVRVIAAWPIPLLLLAPGALLLRSGIIARRRAARGACAKCGYSLAGLAEGSACPECGRKGAKVTE
jgi:hypothetical protein